MFTLVYWLSFHTEAPGLCTESVNKTEGTECALDRLYAALDKKKHALSMFMFAAHSFEYLQAHLVFYC